jgi:ankyrin repeat protein
MKSALHAALRREASLEEIKAIVEGTPRSVFERDEFGVLPIQLAVAVDASVQVLECLLRPWPKSIREQDRKGCSVLHFVSPNSSLSSVQILVTLCPELLQVRNHKGELPLHSAAEAGAKLDLLRFLAQQYPRALDEYDDEGYLPIHRLFGPDACLERIRLFVELDRNFNVGENHPNEGGLTFHTSVRCKCPLPVIRFVYEMWPDSVRVRDELGRSPLCHHFHFVDGDTLDYGSHEVLTFLLNEWGNADPPIDNNGNTLLHHAAEGWSTAAAVDMLLERWPDAASSMNNLGLTPLQCARAQEDPSLGALALLRRGAPTE